MSLIPHGTIAGYRNHGCRCHACRGANAKEMREYRAQHASLVIDGVHPSAPHGTANGYVAYGCRCEPCTAAQRALLKQWRARRFSERKKVDGRLVHPTADHGTSYAYKGFGCRCNVCSANEKVRQAERYQRRKAAAVVSNEASPSG